MKDKTKKEILIKLETRPHTMRNCRRIGLKFKIDVKSLNKFWLGDIEPMGAKKYFFTKKNENEFKKFIISNRNYDVEIKKNLKNKNKDLKPKKDEKLRLCTKCKKKFITKVDELGISYDTRCEECKNLEKYSQKRSLKGRVITHLNRSYD